MIVRIKRERMVTAILRATWQVYLGFVLLWRFRPGLRAGRLEYVQLFKGTVEGAIQGAFVACQQGEALSVIGQPLKNPGEAIVAGHFDEFVIDIFSAADQFVGKQAGFEGQDAAQTPSSDDHDVDQFHLHGVGGVELVDVGVEQDLELFSGFVGEHDALSGEAVAEAVAGRSFQAFGGDRAAGLSAVGAGGLSFEIG